MASGDSLRVELSKNAIEGTLKIGNEIIPVYVEKIDLKNISLRFEPAYVNDNRKMGFQNPKIIRKFVLIERY